MDTIDRADVLIRNQIYELLKVRKLKTKCIS